MVGMTPGLIARAKQGRESIPQKNGSISENGRDDAGFDRPSKARA